MQQDWTNSSGATYSQFTRIFDQEPGQHARIQVFGWSQDFTDQNLWKWKRKNISLKYEMIGLISKQDIYSLEKLNVTN